VVSVFVRLALCDLRCRWCDTVYAQRADNGKTMSVKQVVDTVNEFGCRYVIVTGGEPMIEPELEELLEELPQNGKHITVETSATQFRPIRCDLISISPKLSNSTPDKDSPYRQMHEQRRLNISAIQRFIEQHDYQLKFVASDKSDLDEIEAVIKQLTGIDRDKVMLMAQARTQEEYRRVGPTVAQMCIDYNYRYCQRLHVELWSDQPGR